MNHRTWGVTLAFVILSFTGLLTGCVTTGSTPASGGLIIEPPDALKLGYTSRWLTSLSVPRGFKFAERLDDLVVTVEPNENIVSAVAIRDGSVKWRRVVGEPLVNLNAPTRVSAGILINSENRLYTLSPDTGVLKTMSNLQSPVADAPAVEGDIAVFGGVAGRIFGHSISAGSEHWAYQLSGSILVRPIMVGGNAFLADNMGDYIYIRVTDGEMIWRGRAHARITADPVATAQTIYVASEDQSLYAINRSTGKDRWIYRAKQPLKQNPILLENSIYLPLPGEGLVSIDALSGTENWRIASSDARPIMIRGSQLLLFTPRSLMVIDAQSGKLITQVPVQPIQGVIPGPDNSIVLVSTSGRLQRLDPR